MIKSYYYQLLNFIQKMPTIWYFCTWMVLVGVIFILVTRFFKIYNGSQKTVEKGSLIFLAVLLFAVLVFLTYARK